MLGSKYRGAIAAAAIVVGLSVGSVPVAAFAASSASEASGIEALNASAQPQSATEDSGATAEIASTNGEAAAPESVSVVTSVAEAPAPVSAQATTQAVSEDVQTLVGEDAIAEQAASVSQPGEAASTTPEGSSELPTAQTSTASDQNVSGDVTGTSENDSDAATPSSNEAEAGAVADVPTDVEPMSDGEIQQNESAGLSVTAHVADKGWLEPVGSGEVAGTIGESRQMEAITIEVVNPEDDPDAYSSSDIEIKAHVENIGWEDWVSGGEIAGTTGQGLRLEALWLRLRDGSALASDYELWYRAHVQDVGWMSWTSEGPIGSTGQGLRLEALQVMLLRKGSAAPGDTSGTAFIDGTRVSVQAHVQDVGWQGWTRQAGQTAGTTGRGLRIEALRAEVENNYLSGGIEYNAQVENIGWQGWEGDGALAGTTGQSLRVEAIKMRLTGELAEHYDVWYRAHVQNFGWMAWTSDAQSAGTEGLSGRMEAVQVLLVAKGAAAPTASDQGVSFSFVTPTSVVYTAHVADIGWQSSVKDGELAGTTGQSKQVEAFAVQIVNGDDGIGGGVQYRAYVANKGWLDWAADGGVAGTTGEGLRVEAIQVQLTGELAQYFDVYYQTQIADIGWLGWASDGSISGSSGISRAVEAMRIKLVFKGNDAPGSSWHAYVNQNTQFSAYYGYQTPGNYYKVSTTRVYVGGSGIFAYSSPVRISSFATRQDCINAFITRALDYVGSTPYVWDYACAPGVGVDCAGLVMQALYAVGMDLGPHYTPYRHYYVPGNDHYANDMANDSRFARVYNLQRGDLVFMTGHVAIYLGNGRIVEAANPSIGVRVTNLYFTPTVIRRPFV